MKKSIVTLLVAVLLAIFAGGCSFETGFYSPGNAPSAKIQRLQKQLTAAEKERQSLQKEHQSLRAVVVEQKKQAEQIQDLKTKLVVAEKQNQSLQAVIVDQQKQLSELRNGD